MKNKKNIVAIIMMFIGVVFYLMSFIGYIVGYEDSYLLLGLGGCFSSIGFAFNKKVDQKKNTKNNSDKELTPELKEKYDKIIEYVKEKYSCTSYHISEDSSSEAISLTDSKFGGYPYWISDMSYPVSSTGEKLYLLAQINFEQIESDNELLPKHGILQFFIRDDELCGANFDNPTKQENFRVIYHKKIKDPLSIEELQKLEIPSNTTLEFKNTMLPSIYEDKINFTKTVDYISYNSDEFEEYVKEAMNNLYGWSIGDSLYSEFGREGYNYLTEKFDSFSHKMLGCPAFTQSDPRLDKKEIPEGKKANTKQHYNILLFQMNSDGNIMWGDDGIANFFINSEALKNLDFSDVLYNWDCY